MLRKLSLAEFQGYVSSLKCNSFVFSSDNQPCYKNKSNVSFKFIFPRMVFGHSAGSIGLVSEGGRLFFDGVDYIEILEETEISVSMNIVFHDPFDKLHKFSFKILAMII